MKRLLFITSTLFLFSCEEKKETSFKIELEAVIKENDSINVYYTNNENINFDDLMSFKTKVNGSNKNQKILLNFPDTLKPKQLRLDFGKNTKQPEIVLNKLTISYKNKQIIAKGKEIFYIFREDQNNTIIDKLNGNIKRKAIKQINGPSLYPKGNKLYNRLNQLYKEK